MKKTIKLLLIIICVFLICACSEKENPKEKIITIENTKYFRFYYSVGYHYNGSYLYDLELNDGKYYIGYKIDGISDEDKLIKEISKDTLLELESILTKHNIYKWNGFDKSDNDVLDGDSFSLYYKKENDEKIDATGYMMYPDGYKEFRDDIHIFYEELFKNELEIQRATLNE